MVFGRDTLCNDNHVVIRSRVVSATSGFFSKKIRGDAPTHTEFSLLEILNFAWVSSAVYDLEGESWSHEHYTRPEIMPTVSPLENSGNVLEVSGNCFI